MAAGAPHSASARHFCHDVFALDPMEGCIWPEVCPVRTKRGPSARGPCYAAERHDAACHRHTDTHTHACTHTHAHTHMHIHKHACTRSRTKDFRRRLF